MSLLFWRNWLTLNIVCLAVTASGSCVWVIIRSLCVDRTGDDFTSTSRLFSHESHPIVNAVNPTASLTSSPLLPRVPLGFITLCWRFVEKDIPVYFHPENYFNVSTCRRTNRGLCSCVFMLLVLFLDQAHWHGRCWSLIESGVSCVVQDWDRFWVFFCMFVIWSVSPFQLLLMSSGHINARPLSDNLILAVNRPVTCLSDNLSLE